MFTRRNFLKTAINAVVLSPFARLLKWDKPISPLTTFDGDRGSLLMWVKIESNDKWQHRAIVWDDDGGSEYRNGEYIGPIEQPETYEAAIRRLFGKNLISYQSHNFMLNRAATPEEILEVYKLDI